MRRSLGGLGGYWGSSAQPLVQTGNNSVDGGSLANSAGITQVSQNTGLSGMVQQSVNVQSNLSVK